MDYWNDPLPMGVLTQKLTEIMSDVMKTSLNQHEEASEITLAGGSRPPGGHTIKKHAGKTDAQLKQRFTEEVTCKVSSSFYHDISFAETLIAKALLSHLEDVYNWYTGAANPSGNKDLDIEYTNNFPVGRKFRKKFPDAAPQEVSNIIVVLRRVPSGHTHNGRSNFILTAYPN